MTEKHITERMRQSYAIATKTQNAKPPETYIFVAATQQQVRYAIEYGEGHGVSPTIDLAKQHLYDPNVRDSIFHPDNISMVNELLGISVRINDIIGTSPEVYTIQSALLNTIIDKIVQNPEKAFINN